MSYRLIAADFDGTLVPIEYQEILPRTRAAIAAARAQGVVFTLVSGRAIAGLQHILVKFGVDPQGLYLIGFNGAQVVQAWDGAQLSSFRLDRQLASQAVKIALSFDVAVMIPEGDQVFTNRLDHETVNFETGHNGTTAVLTEQWDDLGFDPCKVLFGGENGELQRLAQVLRERFDEMSEVLFSASFLLEFNAKGVTKGNSLRGLCETIGIDIADTIAFGDNHNDISMLQAAGLGVAMGNAVPEAKKAADLVTADSAEDGIAVTLEELGLAPKTAQQ